MTNDSRNYSGPGAVGAVPIPGRNAAGVPKTPGPGAAGADSPPLETFGTAANVAYVVALSRNSTCMVGPTCLTSTTNGTFGITADYLTAATALAKLGAQVVYNDNALIS